MDEIQKLKENFMETEEIVEKKGWSWLGFLFAPSYYAGYGDLTKGFIFAIISGFPLFAIFICIYGGLRAKKELPIGEVKFKWLNVLIVIILTIASSTIIKMIIASAQS